MIILPARLRLPKRIPTSGLLSVLVITAILLGAVNVVAMQSVNNRVSELGAQLTALNKTLTTVTADLGRTQGELSVVREAYYPLLVRDALGRVVTINFEPTRIVSGSPSITETLFALGLSNKIVGVDSYSDYPPELTRLENQSAIQIVGGFTTLDVEKVASLRPDLVVAYMPLQFRFIPALENLGLTVIAVKSGSISDVREGIQLLAKVTSKVMEGTGLIKELNSVTQNVSSKVSGVAKTKVLELSWMDPMYSTGNGTYLDEIIWVAGGSNIMVDKSGYMVTNPEEIVARNPSVIIFDTMHLPKTPAEISSYLRSLPGFENVDAIKNNRLYILTAQAANAIERAGPRLPDAIKLLAYMLHPEIFGANLPTFLGDNYTSYLGR